MVYRIALITIYAVLLASTKGLSEANKVYVLQGPTKPILIAPKSQTPSDGLFMRDPNLDGAAITHKKVDDAPSKLHAVKKAATPKKALANRGHQFKAIKIAGSVRMPRVAFSKVTLPVGMREETSRTEFIDRYLLDAP